MSYLCTRNRKREFSSAGSEHLPYKQRVGGSNPSTPTKLKASNSDAFLFCGNILPTIFTFPPLYPSLWKRERLVFAIVYDFSVCVRKSNQKGTL